MAFIVAEPCVKCKFTDCVTACPVDCFYEGVNMLVIHPEECIDCGACVPECPVEAIFEESDVPSEWDEYIELNAKYAEEWPQIVEQKDPMDSADEFREVAKKRELFDPTPGG